ncbi:MAG: hypothetical protein A2284_04255 [Deltaproteobacteria bacterium RIFOXYA12_FULL_61_11]|nr:MAG: hypothetical protein A2284_04255 [Deltaproteobacteria bacterium RIFOXYA12_FULL_61_11]
MYVTNVSEAKTQLSQLLERVRNGEEIILGKAGKPVAKLVPYTSQPLARVPGQLTGKITIADDFNELPKELALVLGMQP